MTVTGLNQNSSFDQVAQAITREAKLRNYSNDETIAILSTGMQESSLNPNAVGGNGAWKGIYQQDESYPLRDDPNGNINEFLKRLDKKRASSGASQDIWKNIFWLQQRPGEKTADIAYANGRKEYLTEIKKHINKARSYVGGVVPQQVWVGDPVWLEDVLKPELGSRLKSLEGWRDRGHGDFKDIRGVMFHHTGNSRETAASIAKGRSDLPGPLSQLHIDPKGIVTIVAVGVSWHAGEGSYPWLPTNMGNWHLIGIECAWPNINPDGSFNERQRWPDAQIISIRDTVAALLKKLGFGSDRVIGHKEYAGLAQGKWDPGNVEMSWFRKEVAKDMEGFQFPGETTSSITPLPTPIPLPPINAYAGVLLYEGIVARNKVIKLQARLKRNYSKLLIDGIFGPHTKRCVVDYQRLHPPLNPDGIVGPETAASLGLVV